MGLSMWWHFRVLGHGRLIKRVTVPLWDPWSTGTLITCHCGKEWAQ